MREKWRVGVQFARPVVARISLSLACIFFPQRYGIRNAKFHTGAALSSISLFIDTERTLIMFIISVTYLPNY